MAETLHLVAQGLPKPVCYAELLPQIKAVIEAEPNLIANLANIAAILKEAFGFFWVGFYLRDGAREELVLGPFQGSLACTRIPFGKGVCGEVAMQKQTLIVPDVEQFPGHIACSARSRSEIVVPMLKNGEVYGVLDVDSEHLSCFDEDDAKGLEAIVAAIELP
ncbi:MAG: GAF domain-containing protein [Alphaproteobacteria bacterium]|nr:GAF domain-containing protein [Alphaproteobacteria bacterium]